MVIEVKSGYLERIKEKAGWDDLSKIEALAKIIGNDRGTTKYYDALALSLESVSLIDESKLVISLRERVIANTLSSVEIENALGELIRRIKKIKLVRGIKTARLGR